MKSMRSGKEVSDKDMRDSIVTHYREMALGQFGNILMHFRGIEKSSLPKTCHLPLAGCDLMPYIAREAVSYRSSINGQLRSQKMTVAAHH